VAFLRQESPLTCWNLVNQSACCAITLAAAWLTIKGAAFPFVCYFGPECGTSDLSMVGVYWQLTC
jgi:hypothetical protein